MQLRLAEQAAPKGWSVRELERRRAALDSPLDPRSPPPTPRDPDLARLEERLRERLAAPVRLRYDAARGRGRIEIGFASLDECDGILERRAHWVFGCFVSDSGCCYPAISKFPCC
jgi:ParB family chromosome partitioning protein